jgi:hypothetical protein
MALNYFILYFKIIAQVPDNERISVLIDCINLEFIVYKVSYSSGF